MFRYGRERPRSVTSGEVFIALSRDPTMRAKLGEVHRKLFEGEGVRKGSSPDHFIYVAPGKARSEINEVASWIRAHYGDPAGTVPARTPFGYLSGKYDGWITLFAALLFGGDRELAVDFTESVARMSWSTYETSRAASSGYGGTQTTATEAAPPSPEPATAPQTSRLLMPYSRGEEKATPAPPAPAPAPPQTPKPGFMERFFGIKPKPKTPRPAPPAPRRIDQAPFTSRALALPAPPEVAEESEVSEEEVEAEREIARQRRSRYREIEKQIESEPLTPEEDARAELLAQRYMARKAAKEEREMETIRGWVREERARHPKVSEVVGESDETTRARARAELEEQVRLEGLKEQAREEAQLTTVERLKRPPGSSNPF